MTLGKVHLCLQCPEGLPYQPLHLFSHALPFQEHWHPIPHVSQPLPHQLRGISGEPLQWERPVPINHRQHPTAHPPDGSQPRQHHQQHSPQL